MLQQRAREGFVLSKLAGRELHSFGWCSRKHTKPARVALPHPQSQRPRTPSRQPPSISLQPTLARSQPSSSQRARALPHRGSHSSRRQPSLPSPRSHQASPPIMTSWNHPSKTVYASFSRAPTSAPASSCAAFAGAADECFKGAAKGQQGGEPEQQ